jgi:Fe2+ transport system protein B
MNTEKEYIEPEVLEGNSKRSFEKKAEDFGTNFSQDTMNEQRNNIKKQVFMKGGALLLPYILGALILLVLMFGIIFLLFAHPFDYIISGIILFFIIKGIVRVLKIFK